MFLKTLWLRPFLAYPSRKCQPQSQWFWAQSTVAPLPVTEALQRVRKPFALQRSHVAVVEPSLCHEYYAGDFSTSSLVLQYSLLILQVFERDFSSGSGTTAILMIRVFI